MAKLLPHEIERLKTNLKEKGYKFTSQRRAILNTIIENEGNHLTVEEIYDFVKKGCPEIGLATVYRTMQLLDEMGVIYKVNLKDDGCNRYELVHEDENHQHHHLICIKCGKVIEVEHDWLGELETKIEKKYDFCIKNHSVKFYGLCSECKKTDSN